MPGSGLSPGESKPADEQFSLEGQTQPEETETLNWEDMPKIGYLKEHEWRLKGSNPEADKVQPYVSSPVFPT
jgi:hypothetical protein